MKLILSSWDFKNPESKNVILENLPMPISECVLLYIPNEYATPEKIKSDLYHNQLSKHGFTRENIFVFDHANAEEFRGLNLDVIYVSGGNTFAILDKIKKSGFDKEIIDYVNSGVTYIGGSAGAHIITPDIEHILKYDENNVGMNNFTGLGLIDSILICHYTYLRREHLNDLTTQGKYPVKYLTDSDSIVVEGNLPFLSYTFI